MIRRWEGAVALVTDPGTEPHEERSAGMPTGEAAESGEAANGSVAEAGRAARPGAAEAPAESGEALNGSAAEAPAEAQHAVPAPPGAPRPYEDPALWGRVDEDGTVYLRTATGERAVGSWHAGSPEEGLAYYGRRYDDLATEVDILEHRVHGSEGELRSVRHAADRLRQLLPAAHVVGDLDALDRRLGADPR